MERRGFGVFRVLAALFVIGALVAGGIMLYQAGQAQGYALGVSAGQQLAAPQSGQSGQTAPGTGTVAPAPYYPYYPGYGFPGYGFGFWRPHFFPFGPLFGLFFFFGLFFLFGGLMRMLFWRRWAHGPAHWHGGTPPWHQTQEQPKAEEKP